MARGGGWWGKRQIREHSVPAGDKGEACQRAHSSELTHNAMNVTYTHTCTHIHTHAHTVIIYLPSTVPFSTSFYTSAPFLLSLFLLRLIVARFFFALFPSPVCIILQLLTHFLCHSTLDKEECTVSQIRCILRSPFHPCCLLSLWEMHQYPQQPQQFMQERDFLL